MLINTTGFILIVHCLIVYSLSIVFNTRAIVYRATISAVSCLVVRVFICIYLLIVMCFKLNDDITGFILTIIYSRIVLEWIAPVNYIVTSPEI